METTSPFLRGGRGRGGLGHDGRGRPLSRNKHWSATDGNRSQTTHLIMATMSDGKEGVIVEVFEEGDIRVVLLQIQ
jgi:hypothetical protein